MNKIKEIGQVLLIFVTLLLLNTCNATVSKYSGYYINLFHQF